MPHRRYLHRRSRRRNSSPDTETKRIICIEDQIDLRCNVCGAADDRNYFLVLDTNPTLKNSSRNALLPPYLAFRKFPVRVKAGELCARTGSAGRTIILDAGAEHEVAAVGIWR